MIICVHVNGKILKYATLIDPLLVKSYRVHPDVHMYILYRSTQSSELSAIILAVHI